MLTLKPFPLIAASLIILSSCATPESKDAAITSAVNANLRAVAILPENKITVQTVDQVVYLNGLADTERDLLDAVQVAYRVPGVTRVVDKMAVQR
jgi:osmotically-inducible protein OsmY